MLSILDGFFDHWDELFGGLAEAFNGGEMSGGFGWCRPAGGYQIYASVNGATPVLVATCSAADPEPERVHIDRVFAGDATVEFSVSAVSPGGAESERVGVAMVRTDALGHLVAEPPATPVAVTCEARAGGYVMMAWAYPPGAKIPDGYRVSYEVGGVPAEPVSVATRFARLGPFDNGVRISAAVSARIGTVYGQASADSRAVADASPPPVAVAPVLTVQH